MSELTGQRPPGPLARLASVGPGGHRSSVLDRHMAVVDDRRFGWRPRGSSSGPPLGPSVLKPASDCSAWGPSASRTGAVAATSSVGRRNPAPASALRALASRRRSEPGSNPPTLPGIRFARGRHRLGLAGVRAETRSRLPLWGEPTSASSGVCVVRSGARPAPTWRSVRRTACQLPRPRERVGNPRCREMRQPDRLWLPPVSYQVPRGRRPPGRPAQSNFAAESRLFPCADPCAILCDSRETPSAHEFGPFTERFLKGGVARGHQSTQIPGATHRRTLFTVPVRKLSIGVMMRRIVYEAYPRMATTEQRPVIETETIASLGAPPCASHGTTVLRPVIRSPNHCLSQARPKKPPTHARQGS